MLACYFRLPCTVNGFTKFPKFCRQVFHMPGTYTHSSKSQRLKSRSYRVLLKEQPLPDRLIPKYALRQKVIPLHMVMVRIYTVLFIPLNAMVYVCDVQIPVGVNHKTFARVWEGENPREEITNPCKLYPDRNLQVYFGELSQSLFVVVVASCWLRVIH